MVQLNIDTINLYAPYLVKFDGNAFVFETDNGIVYRVDFELDSNPYYTAYWFNLANPEQTKSPSDKKIPQTVIRIIEEFFDKNPDVLLYMCSTERSQQAMRARLFLHWFNGYEQQKRYLIKSAEVNGVGPDNKPIKEYVALIVQRTHPLLDEIVERFDEEIQMFNDYKP